MNKEAKAIVDYLEEEREAIRTLCYYPDDVLNCEDLIMLMDYIKQLEEEIRILKEHPFLSKEAFKKLKITTIERGKGGCNE